MVVGEVCASIRVVFHSSCQIYATILLLLFISALTASFPSIVIDLSRISSSIKIDFSSWFHPSCFNGHDLLFLLVNFRSVRFSFFVQFRQYYQSCKHDDIAKLFSVPLMKKVPTVACTLVNILVSLLLCGILYCCVVSRVKCLLAIKQMTFGYSIPYAYVFSSTCVLLCVCGMLWRRGAQTADRGPDPDR